MSNPNRHFLVIAATIASATIVLALGACAPSTPVATATPAADATIAAPPTPTPTPTDVALALPVVRVPLTCAELAPASQLSTALGTSVTLESQAEEWTPQELRPYVYVQDGALDCAWSSNPASATATNYHLMVMPDVAPKAWAKYKSEMNGSDPASPFGANTILECQSSPKDLQCTLDAYIGSTWLTITDFSSHVSTSLTTAKAFARFKPAFTTAVNAVTNATVAEPAFGDPAATPVTYSDAFTISDSAISAATGVAGYTFTSEAFGPEIGEDGPSWGAETPVNFRWEGGGGGSKSIGYYNLMIEVLPSGAWAFPQLSNDVSDLPGFRTLDGVGDRAVTYSLTNKNQPLDTVIEAASGGNLYSIEVYAGGKPVANQNDAAVAQRLALAVISGVSG